ncbi:MAG: Gfo/Idh/MocA family oxidoreductase [Herpetosiphon sp.]
MSNRPLRIGVISTANIGRKSVIPAMQRAANVVVAAIAGRDERQARDFAAELAIPNHYGSYDALLADADIDAVYIPLPNSMHREWTIKAAHAGKHILCEKPLGLTAAECREMAAAAEACGVVLMEAFMYRFHPQLAKVRTLLADGAIGAVRLLQSSFSFLLLNPANIRLRRDLGGGSLMDVGCYCVNLSRTLFEAEPVEVQAFARWSDGGVDEQMAGSLRFADGRLAQFDCALHIARREAYHIAGTDGTIDVPVAFVPRINDTVVVLNRGTERESRFTIPAVDEYQLMAEHFVDAVLEHRQVRYPAVEAAANMRVIEALYRSAHNSGRPEMVEQ